jgi:hypothetical protein
MQKLIMLQCLTIQGGLLQRLFAVVHVGLGGIGSSYVTSVSVSWYCCVHVLFGNSSKINSSNWSSHWILQDASVYIILSMNTLSSASWKVRLARVGRNSHTSCANEPTIMQERRYAHQSLNMSEDPLRWAILVRMIFKYPGLKGRFSETDWLDIRSRRQMRRSSTMSYLGSDATMMLTIA